jgi:hypothetical protein
MPFNLLWLYYFIGNNQKMLNSKLILKITIFLMDMNIFGH